MDWLIMIETNWKMNGTKMSIGGGQRSSGATRVLKDFFRRMSKLDLLITRDCAKWALAHVYLFLFFLLWEILNDTCYILIPFIYPAIHPSIHFVFYPSGQVPLPLEQTYFSYSCPICRSILICINHAAMTPVRTVGSPNSEKHSHNRNSSRKESRKLIGNQNWF